MYWLCFSSDIGVVQIKDIDIRFYTTRIQSLVDLYFMPIQTGPIWIWFWRWRIITSTRLLRQNKYSLPIHHNGLTVPKWHSSHWEKWAWRCTVSLPDRKILLSFGWSNVYGKIWSRHQPTRAPEQRLAYWDRLNEIHNFWDGVWGKNFALSTISLQHDLGFHSHSSF